MTPPPPLSGHRRLAGAGPVTITALSEPDRDDLCRFHQRCSPRSRFQRYLTGTPAQPPPHLLAQFLTRRAGVSYAVRPAGGHRIIALGHLLRTPDPAVGEIAVMVENEWQDGGVGRLTLQYLIEAAAIGGYTRLTGTAQVTNRRILHLLAAAGARIDQHRGIAEATLAVVPRTGRHHYHHHQGPPPL